MTRHSRFSIPLLVLLLCTCLPNFSFSADIRGSVLIGAGYLEHPRGIVNEPTASYLSQLLRLSSNFKNENSIFRIGYQGSASQFSDNVKLGSTRHSLGAEMFRYAENQSDNLSVGIQGSVRNYKSYYEIYNHNDFYSYVAFKHRGKSRNLWRGYLALRVRRYSELPEESYLEPHAKLEYKHFSDNRLTVGAAVRWGTKYYDDPVAVRVWNSSDTPSVSQATAQLNLAKGLSDRLAIRGSVEYKLRLTDFPRYVADDIYDSPLLDSYSREGIGVFMAVKWLGPVQTWLELGANAGDHDYGSLLFAGENGGQTREEKTWEVYVSAEKQLSKNLGSPRLKLAGGWRDQDSTLASYTYAGVFASSSLAWKW